jgi:hypothetical protein
MEKTALQMLRKDEFAPFYANYLEHIPFLPLEELFIEHLDEQLETIRSIPHSKYTYSYAQGKWTIAQIIMHLIDAERVFASRALWFARKDPTPLPGYDQDQWMKALKADHLSPFELYGQFKTCRSNTITLFRGFRPEDLLQKGSANGSRMSVRALGYIILGHHAHHFKGLESNYLK